MAVTMHVRRERDGQAAAATTHVLIGPAATKDSLPIRSPNANVAPIPTIQRGRGMLRAQSKGGGSGRLDTPFKCVLSATDGPADRRHRRTDAEPSAQPAKHRFSAPTNAPLSAQSAGHHCSTLTSAACSHAGRPAVLRARARQVHDRILHGVGLAV
eukprot:364562-Chlamydomonas_euryale.AAC.2